MAKTYDYDAVIIGAGISGLVCGCYLAKAGMKTLIVEKNAQPGGYCTSFTRGGFHFDACVHSLGSLREGGIIRRILNDLDLEDKLVIRRYDPSDIIITPDFKIHFWNDINQTISEFQEKFPAEAYNIKELFDYINKSEGMALASLRSITFDKLLDRFISDKRLKAILSLPVLGNAGMASSRLSALTATLLYKEFMIDGGYYPDGSIQALADVLVKRFQEFGGKVYFSTLAGKINVTNKIIKGVEIKRKGFISSRYVISNADATQTFLSLIGKDNIGKNMMSHLEKLEPSLSMFILYLGLDHNFSCRETLVSNTNIWYLPYYDVDKMYASACEGRIDNLDWFLVRKIHDKKSIIALVNAPFMDEGYWKVNKKRLIDVFIRKVEKVIPGLASHVVFKDAATPDTLQRWTLNYKGAAYGWAGIPSQFAVTGFTQKTEIENLYLTGHWATLAQGISGVAYLGRDTSEKIIDKENRL